MIKNLCNELKELPLVTGLPSAVRHEVIDTLYKLLSVDHKTIDLKIEDKTIGYIANMYAISMIPYVEVKLNTKGIKISIDDNEYLLAKCKIVNKNDSIDIEYIYLIDSNGNPIEEV